MSKQVKLERTSFMTSRKMEFCSIKELVNQTGHEVPEWPLVILKELLDNALDACEDAGIPPEITIKVDEHGITVTDNGPGLPESTIEGVLDPDVRISSREAYVAPDRGAQGNALKTILAMPYAIDGEEGVVEIGTGGKLHGITFAVDQIAQEPQITRTIGRGTIGSGTRIFVKWENEPEESPPDEEETRFRPMVKNNHAYLRRSKSRFLQIAENFTWINPHLTLTVDWFGENTHTEATDPNWKKWMPQNPTPAHWYTAEKLTRLICAYITHDRRNGGDRTVRDFISEFKGFSGSAKQKKVLESGDYSRLHLSDFVRDGKPDENAIRWLLNAMQEHSKPVKPGVLGLIGENHMKIRMEAAGCRIESFRYNKFMALDADGLPAVGEFWFAVHKSGFVHGIEECRRQIGAVNWSVGINDPFRRLGGARDSYSSLLSDSYAGGDQPVFAVLHVSSPNAQFTDRGKSAVVFGGAL